MESKRRGNWSNYLEFLFSSVGYMVGLGNIWRFPYVCYRNGGGAFLIPYFFFLFVAGLPLTLLEISYCQYSNLGPTKVWECCPLFRGIGYGMVLYISIIAMYYNVIISWCLYYFGNSFFPTLPWTSCDNAWSTDACYERFGNRTNSTFILNTGAVYEKIGTVGNETSFKNVTNKLGLDITEVGNGSVLNTSGIVSKTSSEEFWENHVLELTDGIHYIGMVRWQLLLCSFITLAVTFLCLFKGIKTSGKVAYFAASLPYLFLVILLVRGATLPGSLDGLKFYLIPRWSDLTRFSVWGDASVQALYSIGIGSGNIQTLASYNNFNYDCHRYHDKISIILPIIDAVTSWFAGCVIFVTLGYMANKANVEIADVVDQGPGIAFMVYPEALSTLPLPQFWCALFFLMLFMVGLDSQIVHTQVICSAVTDIWPKMLRWITSLTLLVCLTQFILGIPFVTQGGVYIVQLIDWYVPSITMIILILFEVLVLSWVYGAERLCQNIEVMVGRRLSLVWIYMWKFATPVCAMIVFISSVMNFSPVKYGEKTYPDWARVIGWIAAVISLIPIPLWMCREVLFLKNGSLLQKIKLSVKSTDKWKPATDKDRSNVNQSFICEDISEVALVVIRHKEAS